MEYPKALYLAGQQLVVEDAEQEAAARANGHDDWHADHERTEGAAADAGAQDEPEASNAPLDRGALKARAAELGIEYPANIKTDKLAALVAAKEAE